MTPIEQIQELLASETNPRFVREIVENTRLSLPDVAADLRDPDDYLYGWKTFVRSVHLKGVLLKWTTQQVCLPHDHGPASAFIHVIDGEAYHAIYRLNAKRIPVLHKEMTIRAGSSAFVPRKVIHAMASSSDRPLVMLNVYMPNTAGAKVYDLEKRVAAVVSERCGAWWPTKPEQLIELIDLDKCPDDSGLDLPFRPRLEFPHESDACGSW